jgi:ubiquinone biosynthesis protein
VHRARLSGGEEVVVKAVKANVRNQFAADVASLKRLFSLAIRLYPRLRGVGDPIGILEDVETYTLSELDLRNEAEGQATLRRIRDAYGNCFSLERLKFPGIYRSLSNENVLVSNYVPGPSVDELLGQGALRYETLIELFRLHGFYMFCVGQFHGDLHPGNVLLDGKDFYFVDTGYIGSIAPVVRDGLFGFFSALADYDYAACVTHLHSMSTKELDSSKLQQFETNIFALYADFHEATVSEVSLTRRMMQTIKLGVNAGMAFDRSIFSVIRSLMYLDGMVLRCNPDAVLMRDMRPLLDEFLVARRGADSIDQRLND